MPLFVAPAQSTVNELPAGKRKPALAAHERVTTQVESLLVESNKLANLKRSKHLPSVRGAVPTPTVKKLKLSDASTRKDDSMESLWPMRDSPVRIHHPQQEKPAFASLVPSHSSSTLSSRLSTVPFPALKSERTWSSMDDVPPSPSRFEPRSPYASSGLRQIKSEQASPVKESFPPSLSQRSIRNAIPPPKLDIEAQRQVAPTTLHPASESRMRAGSTQLSSSAVRPVLRTRGNTLSAVQYTSNAAAHPGGSSRPYQNTQAPRRPTLTGVFPPLIDSELKTQDDEARLVTPLSPQRSLFITAELDASIPPIPTLPRAIPEETPSLPHHRPTITGASSSPAVSSRAAFVELPHPAVKRSRPRPLLKDIVTTHQLPLARAFRGPESPSPKNTPTVPRMHHRPTIADVVQWMEEQKEHGIDQEHLALPPAIGEPGLRRIRSYDSDISSLVNGVSGDQSDNIIVDTNDMAVYSEPSTPGNAFGSGGFWAGQGLKFDAKAEDIKRWEQIARKRISNDAETRTHSFISDVSEGMDEDQNRFKDPKKRNQAAGGAPPKKTFSENWEISATSLFQKPGIHTRTARSESQSGQLSPGSPTFASSLTASSERVSLEARGTVGRAHVRVSIDSDPSSGDRPFSTVDFLETMGVKHRTTIDKRHPFPEFQLPDDPHIKQAYEEVRSTLIAYWESKQSAKSSASNLHAAASTTSLISMSQVLSHGPSNERPRLAKKPSRFRIFSRTLSGTSMNSTSSAEFSESATQMSMLPAVVTSKKKTKAQSASQFKSMDKLPQEILHTTRVVLSQMQTEFGRMRYPTFEHYVTIKPPRMAADILKFDEEEERAMLNYTIKSLDQLINMDAWRFLKDPKAAHDDRYLQWASKHEFETVLDRQRHAIFMNNIRRKSKEMRIPAAGCRLIWATKYADWASEQLEQATKTWADQLAKEMDKNNVPKLARDDDSLSDVESEYSEDSDDDLYPKVLQEIERDANQHIVPDEDGSDSSDQPSNGFGHTYESFVADLNEDSSEPVSPSPMDESPEDTKRRRRGTIFNKGFINADPVPGDVQFEEAKLAWEEELKAGLAKEKDRQKRAQWGDEKGRGSGSTDL